MTIFPTSPKPAAEPIGNTHGQHHNRHNGKRLYGISLLRWIVRQLHVPQAGEAHLGTLRRSRGADYGDSGDVGGVFRQHPIALRRHLKRFIHVPCSFLRHRAIMGGMTKHNEHQEHEHLEQLIDKVKATLDSHVQQASPRDHEVLEQQLQDVNAAFDEHVKHHGAGDNDQSHADHVAIETKLKNVLDKFEEHVKHDVEAGHDQLKSQLDELAAKFNAHIKHS